MLAFDIFLPRQARLIASHCLQAGKSKSSPALPASAPHDDVQNETAAASKDEGELDSEPIPLDTQAEGPFSLTHALMIAKVFRSAEDSTGYLSSCSWSSYVRLDKARSLS